MFNNARSKEAFSTTWMLLFPKMTVGIASGIVNNRFEKDLEFGQKVKRTKFDLNSVQVRDYVDNTDFVFDQPADSTEFIQINYDKVIAFRLSKLASIQSGPLKPEAMLAAELAKKMGVAVDGDILAQVKKAYANFDAGDLAGDASSGIGMALSTANFPTFISLAQAKLRTNNIDVDSNTVYLLDPMQVAVGTQYLLGKNNDASVSTFGKGYSGNYMNASVYFSNNLPLDATLVFATNPTAAQKITVGGLNLTVVAALTATPGQVLSGADRDATAANIAQAIAAITARLNAPTVVPAGSGTNYIEFAGADLAKLQGLRLSATDNTGTDTLTISSIGGGRAAKVTSDFAGVTVTNLLSGYYGKRKTIDMVTQLEEDMEDWKDENRRGKKFNFSRVFGLEVFSDGAAQFLCLKFGV